MEEFKAKLIEALKDEDVLRILYKSIENSIMDKSNELDGNMLIEFKDELRIYELYKSIDEDELKVLKGIFKGNTLKEFLYCGIQYRNIEALWDYTANKIMKKDYSNLNKLNAIIIFFINSYNLLFEEKVFIIDKVDIGEKFDCEKFNRSEDSKPVGFINEILLYGYKNIRQDEIIRKSIVRVREK